MAVNINDRQFWIGYVNRAKENARGDLSSRVSRSYESSSAPSINYSPNIISIGNSYSSSTPSQSEQNEENHTSAKVIGSVVVIVGSALVGFFGKQLAVARENLSISETAYENLEAVQPRTDVADDLHNFVGIQRAIEEMTVSKLAQRVIALVGLVISGGLIAAGAFAAIPILIKVGTILAIVALAGAAFSIAWNWSDDNLEFRKNTIKQLADNLLAQVQVSTFKITDNPPVYS